MSTSVSKDFRHVAGAVLGPQGSGLITRKTDWLLPQALGGDRRGAGLGCKVKIAPGSIPAASDLRGLAYRW